MLKAKVEDGAVRVEASGTVPEIVADVSVLLISMHDKFENKHFNELLKETLKNLMEADFDAEAMHKNTVRTVNNKLDELIKGLIEYLKENEEDEAEEE